MDGERVRHNLGFLIVISSKGANAPARCLPGEWTEYTDGRWRLWFEGVGEPIRGDRFEGGREAVAALLGVLRPSTA